MSITITATKRVRGMLHARVTLGEDAADCTLDVRSTASDDRPLPATVRRSEEENVWLVSLPSLAVAQTLHLTATGQDGTVVEETTSKLGSLSARLTSNRLSRRQAHEAPALGSSAALGAWDVCVERIIATKGEHEVCQGHARLIQPADKSVEGAVRVRALDARGSDVAAGEWTCLCDMTAPLEGHAGFVVRHVEFSVRVPSGATALVLWVITEGDEVTDGFASLGSRECAELRTAWRELSTCAGDDDTYDVWYTSHHAASEGELAMQSQSDCQWGPLFSVIVVARAASPAMLRETVLSVLSQSYERLELVLVNAAPQNQKLGQAVRGMELADARLRGVPLAADFGLAAATSEGIDAATGDFVCLLDEGDLLAPDALWCLATAIVERSDADLLYTDEDHILRGVHVHPVFKPDWDPDLLLGGNYLGGLLCLRASLLHDLETMGPALDGAQGYHLALVTSRRARAICHLPRVLYHRRSEGSSRQAAGAAELASGLVALRQHLGALGQGATARLSTRVPQKYEVSYGLPEEPPLVSVIVLNRDNANVLDRCLTSVREHTSYERYEVVLVENGSVDTRTFDYYREAEERDERVRTIYYQDDAVFDEARLIDFGVSRATGELLLLLHNDVEVTDDDWMGRLVSLCLREGTGAAAARLLRADGTIESCGETLGLRGPVALGSLLPAADEERAALSLLHTATMASGACLMVRRDAFEQVGGVPLPFVSRFGVEDLCLRLVRLGLRVVVDPQVSVVHHRALAADVEGAPTVGELRATGMLWRDWPFGERTDDPALGPNVTPGNPYRTLAE